MGKKSVFCWIFFLHIYFYLKFMVIFLAETINEETEKSEKRRNEKKLMKERTNLKLIIKKMYIK